MINRLKALFENCFKQKIENVEELPQSGSYRRYFRLSNENFSAIGVYNDDYNENKAFVQFSKHFFSKGINVPRIYAEDLEKCIYLQEDLGDVALIDCIGKYSFENDILIKIYKKIIDGLVFLQIKGGVGLDYSLCVPRDSFDRQSIMWDLNYYKYCWCRLAKVSLNEQLLEYDFEVLSDFLLAEPMDFFLFRDFQCRNIMIKGGEPYFIDYQGGRRGALQYDIASLLYDAIAEIPDNVRVCLLDYYVDCVETYISIDRDDFKKKFYAFAFVRLLQAMGAFGLRGLHENKQHFINSIKPGLFNLMGVSKKMKENLDLPELYATIKRGIAL